MSVKSGLDYTENGLIFAFDTNDNWTSYLGEPTVNLSYNNGQSGSEYLAAAITWVNAGSWRYEGNATDTEKPRLPGIDPQNLRIISGESTADSGSIHFGCGFTYVDASTTYTVSVWYRQNRAGASAPYLRTNITNIGIATLAYNGDTNTSNWPVNKWIRITATGTTPAGENGIYISNYIGTNSGDKIWYVGHQVERNDHVTPVALGTRGNTNGLLDITGANAIDLTKAGYQYDGSIFYDGTNNYLTVSSGPLTQLSQNQTLVAWFDWYGDTSAPHRTLICTSPDYRAGLKLMSYYHGSIAAWVGNNTGSTEYLLGGGATPNGWNMLACTRSTDGQLKLYLNGVLVNSANTGFYGGTYLGSSPMIGGEYHSKYLGEIPMALAYNRVLDASEILDIYRRTRVRYENRGCYLC